ncbi:MAG: hypothetical protein QOI98_920 [Solirubrobacteraceae bacterium]|nr:hypothetical protein [Solirubrobacteraceae bacterium]
MKAARVLIRALVLPALFAAPSTAWAQADDHSPNMRLVGHFDDGGAYKQGSDEAFWGTKAIVGTYGSPGGMRVIDISNPAAPFQIGKLDCPGSQADVSVWKDLVFMSVDSAREDDKCGTGEASETTAASGSAWEGIRIVSIRDPAHPTQIATVRTACGSHTNTLVPDLGHDRILLYVLSYPLGAPNPSCNQAQHSKISVVEVPLSNPAAAKVIATPSVAPTIGCHDVTVFLERKLAGAGCITESQIWDISDPVHPRILSHIYNPLINIHHSSGFSWDGKTMVLGDELGGAEFTPGCLGPQQAPIGALWFYDVSDPTAPALKGSFRVPQQHASVQCTAHDFDVVPLPSGKDILVSAWYEGGTTLVDFTDPANPTQLAYYVKAGTNYWSSYWYNGHVYGNAFVPGGLDVFDVSAPEVGGASTLDHLNTSTQELFPGPPPTGGRIVGKGKHCVDGARPRSRVDKRKTRFTRGGVALRGTSSDAGCGKARAGKVARVRVAVALLTGKRCRFLRAAGGFGQATSCGSQRYLRARGKTKWSFSRRASFPAGRYRAWVRATDARGNLERRSATNTVSFRIP